MKKNSKVLKTILASGLSLVTVGSILTTVGCACGSNKPVDPVVIDENIPDEAYLIENGLVKGFKTDYDMSKIAKCTVARMPEAATGIAQYAFKNMFSNVSNNLPNITTIKFRKNITTIAQGAFFGCTSIQVIDFSCYETETELKALFDDANCGTNVFASMATAGLGSVKFANAITDNTKNNIKLWMCLAGLSKEWFKDSEKPVAEQIVMTGGTDSMSTKEHTKCDQSTETWGAVYEETTVAKYCNWRVTPANGTQNDVIDKIKIDESEKSKGRIHLKWGNDIPAGNYSFTLKAVYVNPSSEQETSAFAQSNVISFAVRETKLAVTGPSSISIKEGKAGTETYTATLDGREISDVTWKLSNDYSGKFTINNGKLTWGGLEANTYSFNVIAQYKMAGSTETKEAKQAVVVNVQSEVYEILGQDKITAKEFVAGEAIYTTKYAGEEVSSTWNIVESTGKIKIEDGRLTWSELGAGNYTFVIWTSHIVNGVEVTATKKVTLNITSESFIVEGQTSLSSKEFVAGQATYIAKYDGKPVSGAGLSFTVDKSFDGRITIDNTGLLKWNNTLGSGNYSFTIHAKYYLSTQIYKEYSINVNLSVSVETFEITGLNKLIGEQGKTGFASSNLIAKYAGKELTTGVSWSLVDTYSDRITISNQGLISWSDTLPADTYKLNVTAQYTLPGTTETKTAGYEVDLFIIDNTYAIEGATKLSGKEMQAGVSTYNAKHAGTIVPSTWTVENDTSEGKIKFQTSTSGTLVWSGLKAGTYTFTVVAKYTDAQSKEFTDSVNVTLTIDAAKYEIKGSSTLQTNEYTGGTSTYTSQLDGSAVVSNWSIKDGAYSDFISIGETSGILTWKNTIVGGKVYTFTIQATYTKDGVTKTDELDVSLSVIQQKFEIEGSMELTGKDHVKGDSQYKAIYAGAYTNKAKWKIEYLEPASSSIKINETTGLLSWDDKIEQGTYSFYITAQLDFDGGGTRICSKKVTLIIEEFKINVVYPSDSRIQWLTKPTQLNRNQELVATYTLSDDHEVITAWCNVTINGVKYNEGEEGIEISKGRVYIPKNMITTSVTVDIQVMDKQHFSEPNTRKYLAEEQLNKRIEFTTDTFMTGNVTRKIDFGDDGQDIKPVFTDSSLDGHWTSEVVWINYIQFQIKISFDLTVQGKTAQFYLIANDHTHGNTYKLDHDGQNYEVQIDYKVNKLCEANGDFEMDGGKLVGIKADRIKENEYYDIYIDVDPKSETAINTISPTFFKNLSFADRVIYVEMNFKNIKDLEYANRIYFGKNDGTGDKIDMSNLTNLRYLSVWDEDTLIESDETRITIENGALPRPYKEEGGDRWYNSELRNVWLRGVSLYELNLPSEYTSGVFQNFIGLKQIALGQNTEIYSGTFRGCWDLEVMDFSDWSAVPTANFIHYSAFSYLSTYATSPVVYYKNGTEADWKSRLCDYDKGRLDENWIFTHKD